MATTAPFNPHSQVPLCRHLSCDPELIEDTHEFIYPSEQIDIHTSSDEASGDEPDAIDDLEADTQTTNDNLDEPHCFEGPEKNLEVCFTPGVGPVGGCRNLSREQLDALCAEAKCTILSQITNQYIDAYVLSESSLFVYEYKMVLKTCGTTTLLKCLALLLNVTKELGMELEWVGYSRKNYTYPGDQMWPHCSFSEEMNYLKSHSHLSSRLNGSGHILGPLTNDHWFVYVADQCRRPSYLCTDRTINIMMFDMHPSVASLFYKSECPTGKEMTARTGISHLVPGAIVDDFAFEPCGYSMNAILHGNYTTVHVTPEPICSYASFETNTPLQSYNATVRNTLNVFKPQRFVLTMFADDAGLKELQEKPFDLQTINVPHMGNYTRTSVSTTQLEADCCCIMANYVLCDAGAGVFTRPSRRGLSFG